jgi:hypothetical protein
VSVAPNSQLSARVEGSADDLTGMAITTWGSLILDDRRGGFEVEIARRYAKGVSHPDS